MSREYMGYVTDACKNGMTGEEVTNLFNEIYQKSNTKKGKKVLRLFAKGIGSTKKKSLNKNVEPMVQQATVASQQYQPIAPVIEPQYQKVYTYGQEYKQ